MIKVTKARIEKEVPLTKGDNIKEVMWSGAYIYRGELYYATTFRGKGVNSILYGNKQELDIEFHDIIQDSFRTKKEKIDAIYKRVQAMVKEYELHGARKQY